MTEKQQKDIASATISEIQTCLDSLMKHRGELSGEEQISKLKEIRDLIDNKTALREFPSEWMKEFGLDGLTSRRTVLGCGWYRVYNRWRGLQLISDTKRVFMNRDIGKHAEVEMLEWLQSEGVPNGATELRVFISRSPCEECLDKIIAFQKAHSRIKIRIGFKHWYHKNDYACSNARKMAESTDIGIEYSVLSQNDLVLFSELYDRHTVSSCGWEKSIQHAYEHCHEREVEHNESLRIFPQQQEQQSRKLYEHNIKIDKPHKDTIRIMSKLFGVQFAFWKWRHSCDHFAGVFAHFLKPKKVRRSLSTHTETVDSLDIALSKVNVK